MRHCSIILFCSGVLSVAAWAQSSTAELDRMIAAGKSQHELAQYLFDTHGCKNCHTLGHDGKLGFTKKGQERAQGFEGCISTLKARHLGDDGHGGSEIGHAASAGPEVRRLRVLDLP